jgi:plastocyanin
VCLLFIFLITQSSRVYAQATVLTFTGAPAVTVGTSGNTGSVNTKARWVNVATVNGVAVDMEAVILANSVSTTNSVTWSTVSGQAKLSLVGEGDQSVDLAYHFYQTGTNTPVVVSPEVIFRSLDGGLRQEVIQTLKSQVAKYTLDNSSSISVTSVLNGAGTADDEYKFTSSAGANLISNPGFESGNTGFTSSYSYLGEHGTGNSIAQGSWGEGKYAYFNDNRTPNSSNSYFNLTTANNGDSFLLIDIGNDTTHAFWQTALTLTPGKNYVFSAYLANINDSNSNIKPNVNFVLANSGGTSVLAASGNLNTGGSSLTPWQEVTSAFTATLASNTLELISNTPGLIGNDLALDDVEVREVLPEHQTGLSLTLQPAAVFYFTFEKANGLGEFAFDGSLNSFFLSPQTTLVDTTAPANPVVTSLTTTDTTPVLSGTAEAYSTVTLTAGGATYSITANGSGNWSLDTGSVTPSSGSFSPLTNGSANSLQAVSTDAAGNASGTASGTLVIQVPAGSFSTISPSPSSIAATGNATSIITVQAKSAGNDNLSVGGNAVVLATNLGTLGSVTDNGNGTYSATLTSATAPGSATINGTINGQAMSSVTVDFVALALGINTVAGDDAINLTEDNASVAVTGTSAGIEAGQTVTVAIYNAQASGIWSGVQVSGGAGSAAVAVQSGYWAIKPSWGVTTNVLTSAMNVGPLNMTGANYSVDVWLPASYVSDGHLTVQPFIQDSTGKTAAITVRAASSLVGNSWNTLSLNAISSGNLTAVASGFDLTAVTKLGFQLNANGKPTSVDGDVRLDNLSITQLASGSPVNLTFAASLSYSASVGSDGSWSTAIAAVDAQALPASNLIVADASDLAGDAAPQARRTLTHTQAAPALTISAVTGDDSVSASEDDSAVGFTGTATGVEDGQIVTLTFNGASYTGAVSSGSWSISVPAAAIQVLGGSVSATANAANLAGDAATQASRSFTAANDAPVITLPTAPVVSEDSSAVAINDSISLSDVETDNQTITLTITGGSVSINTAGLSFSSGDGSNDSSMVFSGALAAINTALDAMTFTPTPNLSGSNAGAIQIAANDGHGGSTSQTLQFDITGVNDTPTITGSPSTSVNQGSAYSFTPTGADVDTGDTITYSIANKPSWASFNTSNGQLTGTPGNSDVGTTSAVVITVTDNQGATSNLASFSLTVNNANDAPTITGSPATSVNQGSAYSFTPTGADVDTGDTITYSIANKPGWASFNTSTGQLTGTPGNSDVGTTSGIAITVTDNQGATSNLANFSLTVNNTNDAPTITGSPATSVNQSSAYSFTPTGADVDTGDTITYSIANKPSWASFNTSTGQLMGTPGNSDVGTTSAIVITVTDNQGATSNLASFSLTVVDSNDVPSISGVPATTATEDSLYSFSPLASDADLGDTLVFSIANKPLWASFNTSTGVLSGTPSNNDVGTTSGIVISVSDGHITAALSSFDLTVSNTNDAPVITLPSAPGVHENDSAVALADNIQVADDDGDAQTLSITVTGGTISLAASGLTLISGDGQDDANLVFSGSLVDINSALDAMTFTPTAHLSGSQVASIQLNVDDGQGGSSSQTLSFDISPSDVPVINLPTVPPVTEDSQNVAIGAALLGNIIISDGDQDSQTVTLTITGGTVSLATNGLTFSLGDGIADRVMTFNGSLADVNAALASLSFTPDANLSGADAASIRVDTLDDNGSSSATLHVDITAVNDAPIISLPAGQNLLEDSAQVSLGGHITVADADGDVQTLSLTATGGSLDFNPTVVVLLFGDGSGDTSVSFVGSLAAVNSALASLKFTPATNLSGPAAAQLRVQTDDGRGLTDERTLNFAITASNDAPVISTGASPAILEDQLNVDLGAVFSVADADADGQTVTLDVAGGTLSINTSSVSLISGAGLNSARLVFTGSLANINAALTSLLFNPAADISGPAAARITLSTDDGHSGSATQNLSLDVSPQNDAPAISGTSPGSVAAGAPYSFSPQATDADSGDSLSFSIANLPSWASFNPASGAIIGTPGEADIGSFAGIVITVTDGQLSRSLPAFTLTVTASNTAPVAASASLLATERAPLSVQASAVDAENSSLTYSLVTAPSHGTLSGTGPNWQYTPAAGYIGSDSFTFTASDGTLTSNTATISISVQGDWDSDGIADPIDQDMDADGIANSVEGDVDTDGDGIPNSRDRDSDNDGIPDSIEGAIDSDGDGVPDFLDKDADNDGLPDSLEGAGDSDVDGKADYRDSDSDNDGVSDDVENRLLGTDSGGDGIDDSIDVDITHGVDLNHDGVDDLGLIDTDQDGTPDMADVDSDGDGIPDALEFGLSGRDQDGDGIDDSLDATPTGASNSPSADDRNGDGRLDQPKLRDTDGDGLADYLDEDSDNDGVTDGLENRISRLDSDSDGIDDSFDVDSLGGLDANHDGISDSLSLLDSDADDVPNMFDLDSDNDGLLDTLEAGLSDMDNNGFADVNQSLVTAGLPDRDRDGLPDIIDLDSDNDGNKDLEQTAFAGLDKNRDGRIDTISDSDLDGIDDRADGDVRLRGSNTDTDGDGVPDNRDSDDDNDGVPDVLEGAGDADGDGIPNRLDRDSDNDGLSDWFEANAPAPNHKDSDADGLDDAFDPNSQGQADSDNDGIADSADVHQTRGQDLNHDGVDDAFSKQTGIRDSDGDSIPDPYDTDSDGDNLSDNLESGLIKPSGRDQDRDGIDDAYDADVTGGKDINFDGIDDASVSKADLDGDGLLAYQDPDTDGDGYSDQIENGDFNNDQIVDREQPPTKMRTAVRGGASSISLILLTAFCLTLRRRINASVKQKPRSSSNVIK